jgi:hypothetical protein
MILNIFKMTFSLNGQSVFPGPFISLFLDLITSETDEDGGVGSTTQVTLPPGHQDNVTHGGRRTRFY